MKRYYFYGQNSSGREVTKSNKIDFLAGTRIKGGNGHISVKEALRLVFSDRQPVEVSRHQYERLRKFSKALMWENDELDISGLKKKQDYSVLILTE